MNNLPDSLNPIQFTIRQFKKEESPQDYAQVMQLRTDVFIKEQQVPEDREQDEYEDEAIFWLISNAESGEPLATGRMRSYQEGCQMQPVAKIERVAIVQTLRGQNLGRRLMEAMLENINAEGFSQAILDAQTPVIAFYEKLGFVAEGEEFMDAGIPHIRMRLVLR